MKIKILIKEKPREKKLETEEKKQKNDRENCIY